MYVYHLWKEDAQTVLQHHRKLIPNVTKNKLTDKDKMISSNNNNYISKCYLNVFTIVLTEIGSY